MEEKFRLRKTKEHGTNLKICINFKVKPKEKHFLKWEGIKGQPLSTDV